ncbi:hypothetical protein ABB37_09858 [Leptomonas pyrrhocoris]|uniref:Uncharacterized protein n=1 Tax=Leptomonas pyrrhocoris TaxID=157538 RepID=A0A0M9FPM9_LEPPY|nr:hypothetical protein ABB37_09858 [Leptomonas pyrrhocoris]KPA73413.1 hypothetical protein ABB37_09858 [Leptomonas pyrrhocoris]|eukprot:XP_015651852.1 hypothetical protein ABB37_09858 [Leptomonas pyrrhocoris]
MLSIQTSIEVRAGSFTVNSLPAHVGRPATVDVRICTISGETVCPIGGRVTHRCVPLFGSAKTKRCCILSGSSTWKKLNVRSCTLPMSAFTASRCIERCWSGASGW